MAIQSSFYTGTALTTRTFPSTKHIATKQHMAVWIQETVGDAWVQMDFALYQLINNSCVLNSLLNVVTYKQLEVRVADSTDELIQSPSDISIVASIATEVTIVAGIEDDVVTVAGIEASVVQVASDTVNVNLVGDDLALGKGTNQPTDSAILNALTNANLARDSAIEVIDKLHTVNTISDLLSTDVLVHTNLNVLGYVTINHGGGGLFNYNSTIDKTTANGVTLFDPSVSLELQGTGVGLGCWVRQLNGKNITFEHGGAIYGGADDTIAIQKVLDSGEKYIEYHRDYIVSSITVPANVTLDGKNSGSIKYKDGTTNTVMLTINGNNVSIINGELDGNRQAATGAFIIRGVGFDNIKITNNKVHDSNSTGISLIGCSNLEITRNTVYDCIFTQISVGGVGTAKNVNISDNHVYESAFGIVTGNGGIAVFATTESISKVLISNNIIDMTISALSHDSKICITTYGLVKDINILGNNTNGGSMGVSCAGVFNAIIDNNNIYRPLLNGIEIAVGGGFQTEKVVATNNTVVGLDILSAGANTKAFGINAGVVGTTAKDVLIDGNSISECYYPLRKSDGSGIVEDVVYSNNKIKLPVIGSHSEVENMDGLNYVNNVHDLGGFANTFGLKAVDCDKFIISNNRSINGDSSSFCVQINSGANARPITYGEVKNNAIDTGKVVSYAGYEYQTGDGGQVTSNLETKDNTNQPLISRDAKNGNPTVGLGEKIRFFANGTITDLTGGFIGKRFTILSATSAATITNSATMRLSGSVDFVMTSGDVLIVEMFETGKWSEVSRMNR